MAEPIEVWRVKQFSDNVAILLQQKGSKLLGMYTTDTYRGKEVSPVDQVGSIVAKKRTARYEPMGHSQPPTARRWLRPGDWDIEPILIDNIDKLRNINDPTGPFTTVGVYAMGRSRDDVIIDAFFADAITGEEGELTTSFPASQQVDVAEGAAAATGLNIAKLKKVQQMAIANEIDLEVEPLVMLITSKQHTDLLNETQIQSKDFNEKPVLVDGMVTRFMGINFKLIERLKTNGSGHRRCPVWTPSGMHLGDWQNLEVRIDPRPDLRGVPNQIYMAQTLGATRLEEKRVFEIPCAE